MSLSMHTVFSAECTNYFDWQSLALYRTHQKHNMGPMTRLLACNDEDLKHYKYLDIMPTHVHPNFKSIHEDDFYPPYNKPGAISHWLQYANVTEDLIFYIDADMVFLDKVDPQLLGVAPGHAVSGEYGYLKGLDDIELVNRFLPDKKENWPLLSKVGGFTLMFKEDMKKVAPLWLDYTVQVRTAADGEHWWPLLGDQYITPEKPRPWISEMYGYAFGAAAAGVDHSKNNDIMLYPNNLPNLQKPPLIIHYGIEFAIGPDYKFDKHWFLDEDRLKCPVTLFRSPPDVLQIGHENTDQETARLSLASFAIKCFNEALTEYNATRCSESYVPLQIYPPPPVVAEKKAATLKNVAKIQTVKHPRKLGPTTLQFYNTITNDIFIIMFIMLTVISLLGIFSKRKRLAWKSKKYRV